MSLGRAFSHAYFTVFYAKFPPLPFYTRAYLNLLMERFVILIF